MKKTVTKLVGILTALALVIGLSGSLIVTKENEYKLIREFGCMSRVTDTAGVSIKIPFIQSANTLPKEILLYNLTTSGVITMDKKTMLADSCVLWRITDPLKFAQTLNSSVPNTEQGIGTVVYDSIKNIISSMGRDDVINGRDGKLSEAIMRNTDDSMDQCGIQLLSMGTKRPDLPTDNKAAVYKRMISKWDKIAATYTVEGQSEAKVVQNATDREIAIGISDAQAEAARTTATGEVEYMRILAEAYNTPEHAEFYEFTKALDAARASLTGSNNTLILPADPPIAGIFMGR